MAGALIALCQRRVLQSDRSLNVNLNLRMGIGALIHVRDENERHGYVHLPLAREEGDTPGYLHAMTLERWAKPPRYAVLDERFPWLWPA